MYGETTKSDAFFPNPLIWLRHLIMSIKKLKTTVIYWVFVGVQRFRVNPFLLVRTNEIPEFHRARSKFMNSHWMRFKIPASDDIQPLNPEPLNP